MNPVDFEVSRLLVSSVKTIDNSMAKAVPRLCSIQERAEFNELKMENL